jgi:3-hydroxyisobutyrate dehydrogenase
MTAIGFLGLGRMGEPMAGRMVDHGLDLLVWNRTVATAERLARRGAQVAATPAEVFSRCDVVVLMLANDRVIDEVLDRSDPGFGVEVTGRTIVNMGTASPLYSAGLGQVLESHGATYVEAPVSGSRVPAQDGELVAMLAGPRAALDRVDPLLAPLTAATFRCGEVPRALETKLAVNVFLIALVGALAESAAFAERAGLELGLLQRILDAGPMASAVSRGKLAKLLDDDLSAQAAVSDVHYNCRLILEAGQRTGADLPLLRACAELLSHAEGRGLGGADMIAMVEVLRSTPEHHGHVVHSHVHS